MAERKANFADHPPKEIEVECPVCFNVVCEPKLAVCCGHSACAACIGQIENSGKPCPLCSQQIKLVDDRCLEQTLDGLTVHCPHKEKGCEWTGELREVNKHLNRKSVIDSLLKGCQFQKGEYQLMEDHSSQKYPECEIECEYHYVGCDFKGLQPQLDDHMSEAIGAHLSLLSKFVQSHLSVKDDEIKALNEELKKQFDQKDVKVEELNKGLKQQGQVNAVQMQQHTVQTQQVRQWCTEQMRRYKKLIIPHWKLILFLFLVAGSVNAYLYLIVYSECDCHRSLHEEQLNFYVKMDGQVQQLDYGITQIKTMLKAEMDKLKMVVNKTRLDVERMYVN